MKCPHCSVTVHLAFVSLPVVLSKNDERQQIGWEISHAPCPSCLQSVIFLQQGSGYVINSGQFGISGVKTKTLVWPQSSLRPCPTEVPRELAADFIEAVRVLAISAQASAALTRRCLQQVLRDHGSTKSKDLADQIDEVIAAGHIPAALADQLDAVRVIGNFAAHPLKSKSSGMILPVETEEAEWNLDVLETVFDHYFVKPAQAQARKDALNRKLAEAGKPVLP